MIASSDNSRNPAPAGAGVPAPSSAGDRLADRPDTGRRPNRAPAPSADAIRFLNEALTEYEILQCIQQGGQGAVYKARQHGTGRVVALKLLLDGPLASERQRYRFEREIELSARLRHANIVTLFESGVVHGRLFYTMEFIDGLPIDDYAVLHDLSPHEIVRLVIKVCSAVHYAHQNGIIHRDLKPANIIVDAGGDPRVFDFGLAKDLASDEPTEFSCSGQVIGTLPYLSPEQAGGLDGRTDLYTDVYTLGVILYQLLTDQFPYPVDDESSVVRQNIMTVEPVPLRRALRMGAKDRSPRPEQINRDLEAIVGKALAKRKDERYASAGELADDLERYLAGGAVRARSDSLAYVALKAVRKHRVLATVVGVIALAIVVTSLAITTSLLRVRMERDRARHAATKTFAIFDLALTELEESVRPLAGGFAVRDRLLAQLEGELPDLQALAGSDEALTPMAIRLSEKRGDIAFRKGDRTGAQARYESALVGYQRLAAAEPTNSDLQDRIISINLKLAESSEDPIPVFERGIQLAETALGSAPGRDAAGRNLSELLLRHAARVRLDGHPKLARDQLERVFGVLSKLTAEQAAMLSWRMLTADACMARGRVMLLLGKATDGLRDTRAALELREALVREHRWNTDVRYALLRDCCVAGLTFRDAGFANEAVQLLQRAAAIGADLAQTDPSVSRWALDRWLAVYNLGVIYRSQDRHDEAQAALVQLTDIVNQLTAADPANPDVLSKRVLTDLLAGQLLYDGRTHAYDAWDSFENAARLAENLVTAQSDNLARAEELAAAYYWLGRAAKQLGENGMWQHYSGRSYEVSSEVARRQPTATDAALRAIDAGINFSSAQIVAGTAASLDCATALLDSAERETECLCATGRLDGLELKYSQYLSVIAGHRHIIQRKLQAMNARSTDPGSMLNQGHAAAKPATPD